MRADVNQGLLDFLYIFFILVYFSDDNLDLGHFVTHPCMRIILFNTVYDQLLPLTMMVKWQAESKELVDI